MIRRCECGKGGWVRPRNSPEGTETVCLYCGAVEYVTEEEWAEWAATLSRETTT